MIIFITGATHTGKTRLGQKMLEKLHYQCVSQDHIKMGLIRSGNTFLTPEDDDKMTDYLWPITREMAKTAIENKQNLIIEGCYIPFDWAKDFEDSYLENIRYICLAFSEEYISNHFDDIKANACCIEARLEDDYYTVDYLIRENDRYIDGCLEHDISCLIIENDYEKETEALLASLQTD